MGIPALRFKALDSETNVGIADFTNMKTSDIFTSPNNQLQKISEELKGLLSGARQAVQGPLDIVRNASDELTRATQDIFGGLKDITGLSIKQIEGQVASLLPDNPVIQNAFKKLANECRNSGLDTKINTRNFKDKFGCGGGGVGKCSSADINGVMNKLTNGALGGAVRSMNDTLQSLVALSKMGYDVGLCKVFQSLTDGLGVGNNVASRGAAILLGSVIGDGNTRAVIDIASQTSGLFPLLENPGAIGSAVANYALDGIGGGLGLSGAQELYTRFDGAMEIMQDGWKMADNAVDYSLANMGDRWNSGFSTGLRASAADVWFEPDNLGFQPASEAEILSAAYDAPDPTFDQADANASACNMRDYTYIASPASSHDTSAVDLDYMPGSSGFQSEDTIGFDEPVITMPSGRRSTVADIRDAAQVSQSASDTGDYIPGVDFDYDPKDVISKDSPYMPKTVTLEVPGGYIALNDAKFRNP